MNELTPASIIIEAHHILKSLLEGQLPVSGDVQTAAALTWLEDRQMVEAMLEEDGEMLYEVTAWGRVALLGRQAA